MSTTAFIPRAASTTTSSTSSTSTRVCFSAPPAKHDYAPPGSCEQVWSYDVKVAPAIVFAILFLILLIAHIALAIRFKKRFATIVIMGVLWEAAAYIFRTLGSLHQRAQMDYNINFLLTLLGPLWINAFVYMTLGRMVHYFIPDRRIWIVKGRLIGRCFVAADIICLLIQTGGVLIALAGSNSHNTSTMNAGLHVFNIGAGFQQGFIVVFTVVLTGFVWRARKIERQQGRPLRPQGYLWLAVALYAALAMISVRCIFRLIEYSNLNSDGDNALLTNEAYEYTLDAVPMLLAGMALAIGHPGLFLVGPESKFPRGAAKKELKRQEKEEKAQRKLVKQGIIPPAESYQGAAMGGQQRDDMELGVVSPSHYAPSNNFTR